jgi:hypothetical protein
VNIYIESTIPSYLVARPALNVLQAARQQLTREWWSSQRATHDLFTSQIVLDEIAVGETAMAKLRLEAVDSIPLLDLTPEAELVTERILRSGLLPATADRDAAHIALATVHGIDILLTWNCRHIANGFIQSRLRRLIEDVGFVLPVISTPEELMQQRYE